MAHDPLLLQVFWDDTLLRSIRFTRARAVATAELGLPVEVPFDFRTVVDERLRLLGPGGEAQDIPAGGEARSACGGLTIIASRPGPRAFVEGTRPSRARVILGASIVVHVGLLAVAASAPGPSREEQELARFGDIRHYMVGIALRDDARSDPPTKVEPEEPTARGAHARANEGRYGIAGPDPSVARAAALREAAEFGMIGLLGAGTGGTAEWGGGRGEGIGLGTIGTIGHGASPTVRSNAGAQGVRAGEWDDNASYREFQGFLASTGRQWTSALDVRDRQFIVVRDAAGKAVPSCWLDVHDAQGQKTQLRTTASGRALLFPHAEKVAILPLTVTARCGFATGVGSASTLAPDGAIVIDLPAPRTLPAARTVEIGFVLDTTGSMSEEISEIKATIRQVSGLLGREQVRLKVGLVEYKDHGDAFVTRAYKLTSDLAAFARTIDHLEASGGGDTPEAVDDGLRAGLDELDWSLDSTVKMAFLVGDAPPHQTAQEARYAAQAQRYAHAGIPVFTIAASGMDTFGQVVWRQVAQYTGGTNMFVLRGGAGPQSAGAGDPLTSCGTRQTQYTSGNLHQLVVDKVKAELAAVDADPMRIRGRGQDEHPATCGRVAQR